ncbi:hypothetical protein V9K67_16945 [Paraflavisolibacter sp. H34]|uniref:hypothetical protein n=1 Tax=Huijunlia imazamoxiresistens TaxID=3127457 RepID=UPI003017BA80
MKKTIVFSFVALCFSVAVNAQADTTGKKDTTVTDSTKKALNLGVPHAAAKSAKVSKVTASSFVDSYTAQPAAAVLRRNPATYAKSAMKA